MRDCDNDPPQASLPSEGCALPARLIQSIAAEFEVILGDPARVEADCARLRQHVSRPPDPQEILQLRELLPLLRRRAGAIAAPLFALLEEAASTCADPWPLLEGMLAARDAHQARQALALARRLAERGSLQVGTRTVELLAERLEVEGSPLGERDALGDIAAIARHLPGPANGKTVDPVLDLFVHGAGRVRRLAARLLDLQDEPASPALARQVLGRDAHAFLAPYLAYTRATHVDLVHLVPLPGAPPPVLPSLQHAERECGAALLREVLSQLGWSRLNLGLEVRRRVGVSVDGSLPLMVAPPEAELLERCGETRRTVDRFLFLAHGGPPGAPSAVPRDPDPIARFRSCNLTHACLLADILDVTPLTHDKVRRILEHLRRLVADFVALFAAHTQECAVLPELHRELERRILAELDAEPDRPQLSAELTRLVQTFEDPRNLGEVRTLHGLKRYLHQAGLRLGFRLVEAGGPPDRTVDLVLASPKRVLATIRSIRYADLEPDEPGGASPVSIPFPVAVVAEGFSRQLLHGHESFPRADVFCYGNEVHYFLGFRNHPAFLRIDYSPPLQGGMIDLEYYGVSKYELEEHPGRSLDAIREFFRQLEFDVQIADTRVHARHDKERALDLGDLCDKAAALFRLVPYCMDLDWLIGSLDLDADARRQVAASWAEAFTRWGVLPLQDLLTSDRLGVRSPERAGPFGDEEVRWSGAGPYRNPCSIEPPASWFASLRALLDDLHVERPADRQEAGPFGQLVLERLLFAPLRRAVERGELLPAQEGYRRAPRQLFERRHAAERFAAILASDDAVVAASAAVAHVVACLERTLSFDAVGSVEGHEVRAARLPLRGENLVLYVLCDARGVARLAFFARGEGIYRARKRPTDPWTTRDSCDAAELVSLLRRNNYQVARPEPGVEIAPREVEEIRAGLRGSQPPRRHEPSPAGRILPGLCASPGRAVGRARLGTEGRAPEDFDEAVLVAPSVRPEHSPILYRAAGIVSTGGGVLSHAGLLATQFRKPSLIVQGEWRREGDGSPVLQYVTTEYREEERKVHGCRISVRRDVQQRSHLLCDGDLVVLDAGEGTLRVLGQDRDALALHEACRQLVKASQLLDHAKAEADILALRGRRLRGRHQIEKLLMRIADPVLACHAVRELLLGELVAGHGVSPDERARLLGVILGNARVAAAVREHLSWSLRDLQQRQTARCRRAAEEVPRAGSLCDVLLPRLEVQRLHRALRGAVASLGGSGIAAVAVQADEVASIDRLARWRLEELRASLAAAVAPCGGEPGADPRCRHLLAQLERVDALLGTSPGDRRRFDGIRARLDERDLALRHSLEDRYVLVPADGGFELFPVVGWKAANLAEVQRLVGEDLVPPWFVVTDRAFREILAAPVERDEPAGTGSGAAATLEGAIEALVARRDLSDAQKSARIRELWEAAALPPALVREVIATLSRLGRSPEDGDAEPYVALRSSAREEDAETAARAGEFETFLFVRGAASILAYLRRTWSGLWTERAIHNRAVLGAGVEPGGGVVIQRMIRSRVSGVLQTIDVGAGDASRMVINAGLGLGEGVVSGTVGVDQITVSKEGDLRRGPLRFRYVTGDKREQVVFDRRTGRGTVRSETLYHQRLRPALEYVELCELVGTAARLEAAYGYPLDLEFAFEGGRLWILQARPVVAFFSALQETLQHVPLGRGRASPP